MFALTYSSSLRISFLHPPSLTLPGVSQFLSNEKRYLSSFLSKNANLSSFLSKNANLRNPIFHERNVRENNVFDQKKYLSNTNHLMAKMSAEKETLSVPDQISDFVREGNYKEAEEAFKELKSNNIPIRSSTYSSIARMYGDLKNSSKVLEIWNEMKQQNEYFNISNATNFVVAFSKADVPEQIYFQLLDKVQSKDLELTESFVKILMDTIKRKKFSMKNFQSFFQHYASKSQEMNNWIKIMEINCNIEQNIRLQRKVVVDQIYADIRKNQIKPTYHTFQLISKHLSDRKLFFRLGELWKDVRQHLPPSVNLYNVYFEAMKKNNDPSSRNTIFQEYENMKANFKPNIHTFNILFEITNETMPEWKMLKQDMLDAKIEPNLETFHAIMKNKMRNMDLKGMMTTLNEIKDKGFLFNSNTFDILIEGFSQKQSVDQIIRMYNYMKDQRVEIGRSTYNKLFPSLAAAGKYDLIYALMDEMSANNIWIDQNTIEAIIDGMKTRKDSAAILQLFTKYRNGEFPTASRSPKTLSQIFHLLLLGLDACGARKSIISSYKLILEDGLRVQEISYPIVLKAYIEEQDANGSLNVIGMMRSNKLKIPYQYLVNLANIVSTQNDVEAMKRAHFYMKDYIHDSKPFNQILDGLVRNADYEGVWNVFQDLIYLDMGPRLSHFEYLIHTAASKQHTDRLELVMEQLCKKFKTLPKNIFIIAIINFSKCGEFFKTIHWFEEMKNVGFTWTLRECRSLVWCLDGIVPKDAPLYKIWDQMKKDLVPGNTTDSLSEGLHEKYTVFLSMLKEWLLNQSQSEATQSQSEATQSQSEATQSQSEATQSQSEATQSQSEVN